jgi:hypothetical protein
MHGNNSTHAAASEAVTHAGSTQKLIHLPRQTSFLIDMWWDVPGGEPPEPLRAFTSSPRKLAELLQASTEAFADVRIFRRNWEGGQQEVIASVSAAYVAPDGMVTLLLDTGELLVSVNDAEPQMLECVHQ